MNSKIVGISNLELPEKEIDVILRFDAENQEYSEFHYGDWKTFAIWNQSGVDQDGEVVDRGVAAKLTSRGKSLPVLNEWITGTFEISKLKLARIHSLGDGVLIPHKDFVEFEKEKRPWARVHIPLLTNDRCLHSEDDTVFRMRPGEIWFLDASNLHSATNFSDQRRLNLCLDFDLDSSALTSIFKDEVTVSDELPTPEIVQRAPMDSRFLETFGCCASEMNHRNFRDAIGRLAKIHFTNAVHIATFFDWMVALGAASGDQSLHEKAVRYARFLQHERQMGERFVL